MSEKYNIRELGTYDPIHDKLQSAQSLNARTHYLCEISVTH